MTADSESQEPLSNDYPVTKFSFILTSWLLAFTMILGAISPGVSLPASALIHGLLYVVMNLWSYMKFRQNRKYQKSSKLLLGLVIFSIAAIAVFALRLRDTYPNALLLFLTCLLSNFLTVKYHRSAMIAVWRPST